MKSTILLYCAAFAAIVHSVGSLTCYRCHSTQPGCGKELNIRLQERRSCPAPERDGGENFCVKVIHEKDGEKHITRECLMTLLKHTEHRKSIPTVRRHGYCEPARNDDPYWREDESRHYCFCNDWNGCNGATQQKVSIGAIAIATACSLLLGARWL